MLDKDVLGTALYNNEKQFNDKKLSDLVTQYGSMEDVRKAFWKIQAQEIINHFKAVGVVNVNVTTAGTATAHTGTGVGTIQ